MSDGAVVESVADQATEAEGDRYARRIRLDILHDAQGMNPIQKAIFALMKMILKQIPNPLLVISYNRSLFGKWFARFAQRGMRESDYWEVTELELFAAFTANRLKCDY